MLNTWWVRPEQLDEDQRRVVALPISGNHLIQGPPGSGKTNLLLLRSTYLARAGHRNVLLIVFTRTLREFLQAGASTYDVDPARILTCRRWQHLFLREHDREVAPVRGGFDAQRMALANAVLEVVHDKHIGHLYECILLDEAQDYLPTEMEVFCKLAKNVYAVADVRQKIYRGVDSLPVLQQLMSPSITTLRFHYRNGLTICRFADSLVIGIGDYSPLVPTCNYDETANPSTVASTMAVDLFAQASLIADQLRTQLRAFPDELFGVLCPYQDQAQIVFDVLHNTDFGESCILQTFKSGYGRFREDARVSVSTIHSAKGLEFRGVHAAGLDGLNDFTFRRNIAYTASTRAKTTLRLYYSKSLPDFVDGALAAIQPLQPLPDVDDLFRRT